MSFFRSLLVFVAALGLLFLAFRYGFHPDSGAKQAAQQKEPPEWASWKEERFEDLGFSIRHPAEAATAVREDAAYSVGTFLAVAAAPRLTVFVPKTRYKGTNFLNGFVTVSASGDVPKADEGGTTPCDLLSRGASGAQPILKREDIAGTSFAVGGASGAGGTSGTFKESLVYHAWYRGRCIELTANLFSSDIRRLGQKNVSAFDRVDAWKQLTDVVHTFRSAASAAK